MGSLDNPIAVSVVNETADRLWKAPHGTKTAIVERAARELGCSTQALYAQLKPIMAELRARKRRSDRGDSLLSITDAQTICGYMLESCRKNGKQLADAEAAIDQLDRDGLINVRYVDPRTGELRRLSASACLKAMHIYGCHPRQVDQPSPKSELRSEHPNHVWQIDPSLCVLYYLKRDDTLRAMPKDEFYKNKPRNLARIEQERVWRYVIVDHTTAAFYVEYVLGAESGENLCNTFINAMQPRGLHFPFCGVPLMVMLDPGSANTGAMFRNLCATLGVRIWINQPGQPWAKGSVEKHNDIIEREFEHRLKHYEVRSLDELNASAWNWAAHFQSRTVVRRHGMTRFGAWQLIKPEQLRLAPTVKVCRQLAAHAPVERTVTPQLRVSFRGREYDVSHVPEILVRDKVLVARNAWADADTAHVFGHDADGRPTHYVVPALERGEYGFTNASVPIGEYHPHRDTLADTHRKAIERAVMGAATDDEAAAKRKAGALPFEGKINPMLPVETTVAFIPRRGTPLEVDSPNVVDLTLLRPVIPEPKREFALYSHVDAIRTILPLLADRGLEWSAAMYEDTVARWPEGVPYDQVEAWGETLWARYRLQVVRVQDGAA